MTIIRLRNSLHLMLLLTNADSVGWCKIKLVEACTPDKTKLETTHTFVLVGYYL